MKSERASMDGDQLKILSISDHLYFESIHILDQHAWDLITAQ